MQNAAALLAMCDVDERKISQLVHTTQPAVNFRGQKAFLGRRLSCRQQRGRFFTMAHRPEHVAPPEIFYNDAEASKYARNTRMMEIQVRRRGRHGRERNKSETAP